MVTEKLSRVLLFAWKRWSVAERVLSRSRTRGALRRAEAACEFWRGVHREAEASLEKIVAPNRLSHAAVSRTDYGGAFFRPPDTDLPETFPDLPVVNCGVKMRRTGGIRV